MPSTFIQRRVTIPDWRTTVAGLLAGGARFAGLYATLTEDGTDVIALIVDGPGVVAVTCQAQREADGRDHLPSLVPVSPAAFWYERAAHDLSGVVADEHPRLDPLLLPLTQGAPRPIPGGKAADTGTDQPESVGPADVTGQVFSLPWGPVRSGVVESVEFLIETPGEDIPHLNIRPHYKHRGIAKQFEGRSVADGVLVAERVEGIAGVAHALAYCHAVEALSDVEIPRPAALLRVLHAELERIANHLDVTFRLADAAGLSVAAARFSTHKERVMRLVSGISASRFGRGVVIPGGVHPCRMLPDGEMVDQLNHLHREIRSDIAGLESSPSFLDRLRGTGVLTTRRAAAFGALGPIGRGSGFDDDDRVYRSYDAYPELPPVTPMALDAGDALARVRVRWHEIDDSVALVGAAVEELETARGPWSVPITPHDGMEVGWSEGPHGEVLYALHLEGGHIRRCLGRSPALHDLVLLHDVIHTDIFTDLPFIEASFGLSYAGVAM